MMPLTLAKIGETYFVNKVSGSDDMRRHLAELGFVIGSSVSVINEINGNYILNVKGTRLALGKSMASRIMVWPGEAKC